MASKKLDLERMETFLDALASGAKPQGTPEELNRLFSLLSRAFHVQHPRQPAIREMQTALHKRGKWIPRIQMAADARREGGKNDALGRTFKRTPEDKKNQAIWREQDPLIRARAQRLEQEIADARERGRLARLRKIVQERKRARPFSRRGRK